MTRTQRLAQGLSACAGRLLARTAASESFACSTSFMQKLTAASSHAGFLMPQRSEPTAQYGSGFSTFATLGLQANGSVLLGATRLRRQPEEFEGELIDPEWDDEEYIDFQEGGALENEDMLSSLLQGGSASESELDEWEAQDAGLGIGSTSSDEEES